MYIGEGGIRISGLSCLLDVTTPVYQKKKFLHSDTHCDIVEQREPRMRNRRILEKPPIVTV